ncbi:MAG: efflux RND transporter periplasmic adaptor subunit [Nitrospiraceae bacterium]|nr:efflux RND transporter periplasmic adaptor subunit [Nitrospiraceae bacterium]
MKRNMLIAVVCIVMIAGAAVVVFKARKIAALPKPQVVPPAVQVASAEKGSLEITAHYLGSIEPFTRSDVSARISGNILSILKREGDTVRKGEEIVVIDDRELVDRSTAVHAEVLATQQKLAGAKSAYETQKSVYERDVALLKIGAISQEALERSRATLDGVKATMDAYEESIKGLSMNSAVARTQAGYAHITAPFSGIVSKRWSEPGDLAVPGKPILTIEKTSPYKVLAQVPQEDLAEIRRGTCVYLTSGERRIETTVNRVYPALGKNMLATVEVLTGTSPFNLPSASTVGFDLVTKRVKGLIVPDQAVVKADQGASVYQVKDGAVHIMPITLLGMGNGRAAISGEVAPGDQVAVAQENKLLTLVEGGKVTLSEQGKKVASAQGADSKTIPAGGKP